MAEPNAVLVDTSPDGITTITINRPKKRNAVDASAAQALYAAFRNFDRDPQQKVAVITGSSGTFCAGYDLTTIRPRAETAPPMAAQSQGPMGPSRLQLSKPVIAAVAGYAVAGGLELSLLADIRIAEEGAIFGVFCRRWGVPLIDGGTVRLPKVVGLGRALDMILTGRPVDADEALRIGLVSKVVGRGQSIQAAEALARDLLRFPQECLKADRSSALHGVFEANDFVQAMAYEFHNGIKVIDSEGVKGAAAFSSGAGRSGSFKNMYPKAKF